MTTSALLLAALLAAPAAKAPKTSPAAKTEKKAEKADEGLSAGDVAKAKELFQSGQKLYKQARYAEAIARFEEAYAVRPHPVIFFNIGKCWEQLGETAKAMRAYRDYLRLAPDAKDRDTVSDAIANLERRLKEKGLQQLLVFADPPTARIDVDGKDLGTSPASIELVAGNHKLTVKLEGYETVERSFVMSISRATEMTINLRPATPELKTPPPPPPPLVDAPKKEEPKKEEKLTLAPDITKPVEPTPAKKGRLWTYVAGGVAVAAVGAGVGLGVGASGAAGELTNKNASPDRSRAELDALAGRANGMAMGANVSYGVAAAAAVTAAVLFFVEGR